MKRIHIPNLFFIQGQPYQGKSSLTRHFRQSLDCEVISTDQLFWRWCDKYHYKETRNVRVSLGRYFPYLSSNLRREWFEYMTNYVLNVTRYGRPDMVIEGWLLTLLPKDLKEVLHDRCNLLTVTMRQYTAHSKSKSFKPEGTDYGPVVEGLKAHMIRMKKGELMPQVKYQRYEDCKHCAGRSASADRLFAFGLPANLKGKTILEIGCSTGYNSIRLAQRGATVYAVDTDEDAVKLACRIANAIYRLPRIRFYAGDILTENFKKTPKFDYIIATNTLMSVGEPQKLFNRAHELLADDGQLLAEVTIPRLEPGHPNRDTVPFYQDITLRGVPLRCPNDRTVQSWAKGFTLTRRSRSAPPASSLLLRVAYTFTKGACSGLVGGNLNRYGDVDARKAEPMGMVDPVPESDFVGISSHLPRAVGTTTPNDHCSVDCSKELLGVEQEALQTH
jgi:2-polyprenyl-3-methyl-5-hydroxy-6-metoxy-1,4-benzoquinol methylase